jgi:hypothetical protein
MIRTTATATATTSTARTTQRPRPQDPNRVRPPRDVATCSNPPALSAVYELPMVDCPVTRRPNRGSPGRPGPDMRQLAAGHKLRLSLGPDHGGGGGPHGLARRARLRGDGPGGLTFGNWRRPAPFPAACLIVSCRWPSLGSASSTRSAPVISSVCPVTNSSISSTSGSRQRAGRFHADLQHRCCRGAASNSGPRLHAGC